MDLNQLRAFVETVRRGSVSAAASVLGLSQPGLSRQLKQLEHELGVTLIDRERRPISLTPAGRSFLPCAETAIEGLDSAIQRLALGDSGPAGPVVIAASTIPAEFLLPGILARFSGRFPEVRPRLLVMDSASVAEALRARRAEVGFLRALTSPQHLRFFPLAEDEIVLVVPLDHPFAEKRVISLAELAGQPFVERADGSGRFGSLKRNFARRGLHLPEHRVVMAVGSSQVHLAAIEAGVGIGFVSRLAIANRPQVKVAEVEIDGIKIKRTLYLAYGSEPLSSAARALVDFITGQRG